MIDLNYYNPLTTVNESEQKTLGKMQLAFNAAIGKSNIAQNNMISNYMSTNESRRLCHSECSKGWSTDTNSWISKIKTDTTPTTDTPAQGLVEVVNSCKAGCDLKWPGTVQNSAGTLGVVKTTGLYTSAAGKEHEITHCNDLAPFAPQTNCVVSDYSWSSCSKDCGPGTKTGTRTVITAPQNGGKDCPVLSITENCNNKDCPSPRDPMNNYWYSCSTGGTSAVYNALTLTPEQKAEAARKWPGKPPSYYACIQSCGGNCKKTGSGVMAEYFTGGMKEGFVEGYTPLQGDFVKACKDAGTRDGKQIPGTTAPGNLLVENRRQETELSNRLKSTQQQIQKSINQMQSKNLGANSSYKTQNIILLKKLASYEQASHKLLKTGGNLDTLGAQQSDSLLRKNSVDLSYYSWLTLAISILGIAITKIK